MRSITRTKNSHLNSMAFVQRRKEQLGEKERLLRDVLSLLRNYGPVWYTEELDSRLAKAVAGQVQSVDNAAWERSDELLMFLHKRQLIESDPSSY
jgi:hypothetical protein